MFEPNASRILDSLKPSDLVLDVGGWACPFNRANHVLDAEPYETRGYYKTIGMPASQGGEREYFSKDTWICRDICGRAPYPYRDKQFDFVICSHVLEDVRDPLWVCSEMMRVGKRGYIEVPSREWESCRDLERPHQVGLSHHRWLIEIKDSQILFFQKYHLIHAHWRFSLPAHHARRMSAEQKISCLWWEEAFTVSEVSIHGLDQLEAELERFVRETQPYPVWQVKVDRWRRRAALLASNLRKSVTRIVSRRKQAV